MLWLGAAAVFYLPLLVIPLRTVENQRARPHWFPEVGYDSYEGAWIKIQIPFGKDQYYYGYYIVNYFTKDGLGLGYVGFYASKKGRRSVSVNFYTINDRLAGGTQTYNVAAAGARELLAAPARQLSVRLSIQLRRADRAFRRTKRSAERSCTKPQNTSQNYSFNHSSVGTQSSSNSFSFTDTRQFNQPQPNDQLNMSNSSSNFGGIVVQHDRPSSTI